MPFSILHFSDLHLDANFASSYLPARVARRCREQLRQTFRRILELAASRKADAVTIAGDLFERERLSHDTAAFLCAEFEKLAPVPVFIAPGNHDAADAVSLYQRGRWPENVNIAIKPTMAEWRLSKEFSLWSAAHMSPSDRQNFLESFRVPEPAGASRPFPILLLHASVLAAHTAEVRAHTPLTLEDIRAAGFTLALLGHYHTSRILRSDKLIAVYPGSPEPLGFQNEGGHDVAWIQLVPGQLPNVELLPLAALNFEAVTVPVDDCQHRDQLIDKMLHIAAEKKLMHGLVRMQLSGQAQATLDLDLEAIAGRLQKNFAYLRLEDQTRPAWDLDRLGQEPTARGEFVRDMIRLIEREPAQKSFYTEAMHYGLQAFEQDEIKLQDMVEAGDKEN
ncbi:MAG: metallophosphoesterase family protein [bacterium]